MAVSCFLLKIITYNHIIYVYLYVLDMEKELLSLQQENDLLSSHVALLESKPVHHQENDNLLMEIDSKYYIHF